MNIIANNVASKLFVAFVAAAMLFTLVTPAKAATTEELQAQITALMAQIASLQAGVGGTATGAASCTFTSSLTIGSQGAEVNCLQNYLTATGHFNFSGASTGYFGPITQSAVAAWQGANGVAPAVGYFGPISQAKYRMLQAATPTTPGTDDSDDDSDDDSSSISLSGQGSLGDTNLTQGDDTDIEEGQEDAPVAELELNFENGDVMISRIDLSFVVQGSGEDQAWDTFESVSLWVDGEKVAEKSADRKSDYLGDEDLGKLRFSGMNVVAMEDEDVTFVIAVTPKVGIDALPATWDVDALNVRYTDADDVTTTDTISETASPFTIDDEGGDDKITVKASSDDPDATTIQVETDTRSGWETIFVFDLDTDDSTNDITVDGLTINVQTDDIGGTDDVISDIRLVADGTNYTDWTIGGANLLTTTYTFDLDNKLMIDAGDRIPVEVQVRFLALTGNYAEGATIQATTTGTTIDADGADTLTGSALSGTATGDVHTLRSEGAILDLVSTTEVYKENDDTDTTDNQGVFTIKFDVTAFENDLFVTKSAGRGVTSTTTGVSFLIEDSTGATVTSAGTSTQSLTSTADTESGQFKVNEGETKSFTLKVEYDPLTAGFYQVQLNGLNFKTTAGTADTIQLALPTEDFETDSLSI